MRSVNYVLAAALVSGVSGTARAQSTPPPSPAPVLAPANDAGYAKSHWTASGYVGSTFGATGNDLLIDNQSSLDVGGEVAYLWRGVVGGEFLSDFAPSFKVGNASIPDGPHLYSYMANAIGAIPLGPRGQFQPFVSGGYGGIQMQSNVVTGTGATATTDSVSRVTWGANIGGGLMAFAGKVGFRGDVRYYRANGNSSLSGTTPDELAQSLLSGLGFWRTGVGVAFQW